MGLLDFLRAAIAPTADARAGYLQGEEVKRERERQQQLAQVQLNRQSILDQIKASLDASRAHYYDSRAAGQGQKPIYDQTVGDDGTVYLRNRNNPQDIQPAMVNGRPLKARAPFGGSSSIPHTLRTKNGIYQWNADDEVWEPTGLESPTSGGGAAAANAARANAKTALDEARRNIPSTKGVPQTIPNPDIRSNDPAKRKAAIRNFSIPNPAYSARVKDSTDYMGKTINPLEKHLRDVTVPGVLKDSTDDSSATTDASAGAQSTTQTAVARARQQAMQGEFDRAAAAYQAAKSGGDPDAETKYNAITSRIAAKYGQGTQ
jgi:hypothetical protein